MSAQQRYGIDVYRGDVQQEWIDVNRHMNVAYYVLAFDYGVDAMWERLGITAEHIAEAQSSTFAVECHVTWQREMNEADPFVITTQILAYDQKRIHQFMRMYHANAGYVAATAEWMNLHVDLAVRRVAPWPDFVVSNIESIARAQRDVEWPDDAGRRMSVANPLFSLKDVRR